MTQSPNKTILYCLLWVAWLPGNIDNIEMKEDRRHVLFMICKESITIP
jgi:hypothetical protein